LFDRTFFLCPRLTPAETKKPAVRKPRPPAVPVLYLAVINRFASNAGAYAGGPGGGRGELSETGRQPDAAEAVSFFEAFK
jgi:hypothetical protein